MALTIHQVAVKGFDNNFSYIIADDITNEALIVDPSGDFFSLSLQTDLHLYQVKGILITHTHADHIDQLTVAVTEFHAPIYVHANGTSELRKYETVIAVDGETAIPIGNNEIQTMYTPGHTDDAVCYYISAGDASDGVPKVITGDTLFVGGCGRTNTESVRNLYESLCRLAALPKETIVLPGHDYGKTPTSTIGDEKRFNAYYQATDFEAFKKLRLA